MKRKFYKSMFLVFTGMVVAVLFSVPTAHAQQTLPASKPSPVANASPTKAGTSVLNTKPLLTDYKGVRIDMAAADVRNALGHLVEKGERQDLFELSDNESAQVFYDEQGKVTAISIDYDQNAQDIPSPKAVLGEDIQAREDGSLYELKRYPDAGYWVAYSRTAGKHPVVTVTMQKL